MNNPACSEEKQVAGPYPGLRPFRDDETEIFFGREEQTDQLLEKLQHSHFIAVVGPSGCGKSSLVRAGLIAALETGFLTAAGAGWRIAEMRPGDLPLARLANALLAPSALGPERGTDASEVAFVQAMLRRGPLGLIEILRETRLPANENLLLLVDQFEEVFRFREQGSADDADAFVALLLASSAQREIPIYVVITMRSDFLGDCALFTGLPEAINDSQYLTPRLSRDQIGAAIVGPARVFGGDVEPALVNRLLNEIGPDPDQLPLLQHVLMRMWARVKGRNGHGESVGRPGSVPPLGIMTMADYEAVGALSEALSSHADQVLNSLSERQQHIVRVMLSRLTERAVGKRDTRRPARLDDVAAVAGVSAQEVIEVVEQLRQQERSFLTPPPPVPITAETVLDIGHESLIRQWHKLYDWVEEEAASAAMYRRLFQTAQLWAAARAALWSSPDLDEALKWRQERGPSKPWALRYGPGEEFELAMNFMRASEDHAARLRQQARKFKVTLWILAGLALCVLPALTMTLWALVERQTAEALTKKFRSQILARDATQQLQTDPELGLLLAIKSYQEDSSPQTKGAVQRGVLASKLRGRRDQAEKYGPEYVPRLTPDGNFAMAWTSSRPDSKVYIQNIKTGGQPTVIEAHGPGKLIELSPDGKYVVVPDSEASIRVWETATGKPITGPLNLEGKLAHTLFGPDGGVWGVMTTAGKLGLWETQTWQPLPAIEESLYPRLRPGLSYDSKYLVAASQDEHLRIWETLTGQAVATIGDGTTRTLSSVSFSPDGKYIITISSKRVVSLWNIGSKEWIGNIGDESHPVDKVQFSLDDSQVLTTTRRVTPPNYNFARLWSVDTLKEVKELQHPASDPENPNKNPIWNSADFSPDGKSILTVAGEVIRIWQNPFKTGPIDLEGHAGNVEIARFSQDSRWIVSTGIDGIAKLWDTITRQVVASFSVESIVGVWLSADVRRLLTISRDGTVRIWDTIDFGSVTALSELPKSEKPLQPKDTQRYNGAMTRNGKYLLAIASGDGFARVWDSSTGHLKAKLGDGAHKAFRGFFSPDGKYAITTGTDKTARVWDVETGKMFASFGPYEVRLHSANFSDDAHPWTWQYNGRMEVWSLKDDKPSVISLIQLEPRLGCVTVSPDVLWLVTCEQREEQKVRTDVVQVRRLPSGEEGPLLRGHTGGIRDVFFSRDGKFAVSASYDKTAKIWEVGTWQEMATLVGHDAAVEYALFSPDTTYLVTVAKNTLWVWEMATGRLISELRGHTDSVKAVAWSPNGPWLVTGSNDHTARVWDTTTGAAVAELYGHSGPIIAVAFGGNPKEIVTASVDGTIRHYSCEACVPTSELLEIAQQRLKAIDRPSLSPSEREKFLQ